MFKGFLGDAFEDLPADEDAEDDGGEEDGVGGEGAGVDDAEVGGEGDFEEVDEEEEAGEDADVLAFVEAAGEEVNGHDGAGGVGEHGGDAGAEAHAPGEGFVLGEGEEFLLFPVEEEFEGEEGDDEPADDDAGGGVVDEVEAPPAGDDAEDGGWGHGEDGFPAAGFAVDEVAHQIGGDEEGEDKADGGFGAEDFGHEDDVEGGGAGEAAFGEADADGSQGGEQDGRLIGRKQGVLGEPVEEGHGSEGSLRSVDGGSGGPLSVLQLAGVARAFSSQERRSLREGSFARMRPSLPST